MDISLKSLEEAVSIRRKIETLEKRLDAILQGSPSTSSPRRGKRRMSAQARAKIAAAMRARWVKKKSTTAGKAARMKGGLTAAGRKRLSQLMKARWAARRRASGKK
jgi:hypothetical protein